MEAWSCDDSSIVDWKGANAYHVNRDGDNALLQVSKYGHVTIARLLIENGVNNSHVDMFSNTAIMGAARYGRVAMAQLLIEKGANINQLN